MSSYKCVLLILFLTTTIFAQPKAGTLKIKPYTFENDKKEKVDAEFGTLFVPENRSNPESNLIELAFVRFKSTAKNPGPPIVYLAGGPGGSGIGAATRLSLSFVHGVARDRRRDRVRSTRNRLLQTQSRLPRSPRAASRRCRRRVKQRSKSCVRMRRSCASYWRNIQRVDLTGYNTNESADDLEDLRKALGANQISLWSISYGTHLAFATMRRHPKSIHRAILAGTEGPDHTYKLPSNIQKHLEDLAAVIKADPEIGKEIPDFLGLMKSVFDRLDAKPETVEITDPRNEA